MTEKEEAQLRKIVRDASLAFVKLERSLHDLGLIKTAHQLNGVTKTLGWEAAEKFKEAR